MTKSNPLTFEFIIACCQMPLNQKHSHIISTYLQKTNLNVEEVLTHANIHAVIPLVYQTLKKQDGVAESLLLALKKHYMHTVQKNMLLTTELIQVMHILNKHDIHAMTIKGPTLAQLAYGDIGLRQYNDIDILIQKKDRYKMIDILLSHGYSSDVDLKGEVSKFYLNAVNVTGFYAPLSMRLLEVHWELLSKNYAIRWEESLLWTDTQTIELNRNSLTILNFEQQLLYLCLHGSKHLFERLIWVCDIDRLIRNEKNICWDSLSEEAERLGILRIFLLSLSLCHKLFHLALHPSITRKIEQDSSVEVLRDKIIEYQFTGQSKQISGYKHFKLLLSMRENISDKILFLWSAIFASKYDDFKFIRLPRYFTFLYPLVRPLRLIIKYFK